MTPVCRCGHWHPPTLESTHIACPVCGCAVHEDSPLPQAKLVRGRPRPALVNALLWVLALGIALSTCDGSCLLFG